MTALDEFGGGLDGSTKLNAFLTSIWLRITVIFSTQPDGAEHFDPNLCRRVCGNRSDRSAKSRLG